jgi:hypothetical protein
MSAGVGRECRIETRESVTPEEVERYWQILPPAQAENIVPIAQAM